MARAWCSIPPGTTKLSPIRASKFSTCGTELNMPADNVHQLLVRMTVPRADPVLFHQMSHKHQIVGVCEHLARQSGLWRKQLSVLHFHQLDVFSRHTLSFRNDLVLYALTLRRRVSPPVSAT